VKRTVAVGFVTVPIPHPRTRNIGERHLSQQVIEPAVVYETL
jgi:hypothetical protein